MATMRAAVFQGKGKISMREVPRPVPGVGEALVRVTLTTICGTDVHILRGEHPVREGLTVGGWRFGNTAHGCQADYVFVEEAYELFAHQRDGVLKVAIEP
jgi:threonine dehydrogenase-like Zn-dependent dehydrogenase